MAIMMLKTECHAKVVVHLAVSERNVANAQNARSDQSDLSVANAGNVVLKSLRLLA